MTHLVSRHHSVTSIFTVALTNGNLLLRMVIHSASPMFQQENESLHTHGDHLHPLLPPFPQPPMEEFLSASDSFYFWGLSQFAGFQSWQVLSVGEQHAVTVGSDILWWLYGMLPGCLWKLHAWRTLFTVQGSYICNVDISSPPFFLYQMAGVWWVWRLALASMLFLRAFIFSSKV